MTGGGTMEKEILIKHIKDQNNGLDEREGKIKTSSYIMGQYGVFLVLALIIILRMISGEDFSADVIMIMMGQASIQTFYLYKQGRNKTLNLSLTIFSLILFLVSTYKTMVYYEIF